MKYVNIYDWSKLSYRDVQNQLASLRSQSREERDADNQQTDSFEKKED